MIEWTGASDGSRLMMLMFHYDAKREYACGPANGLPDTKFGFVHYKNEMKQETNQCINAAGTVQIMLGTLSLPGIADKHYQGQHVVVAKPN